MIRSDSARLLSSSSGKICGLVKRSEFPFMFPRRLLLRPLVDRQLHFLGFTPCATGFDLCDLQVARLATGQVLTPSRAIPEPVQQTILVRFAAVHSGETWCCKTVFLHEDMQQVSQACSCMQRPYSNLISDCYLTYIWCSLPR